jgi:hypothetical protein
LKGHARWVVCGVSYRLPGVMEADHERRRTSSSDVKLRATPRFTSSTKEIGSFPKARRCFPPGAKAPGAALTRIRQLRGISPFLDNGAWWRWIDPVLNPEQENERGEERGMPGSYMARLKWFSWWRHWWERGGCLPRIPRAPLSRSRNEVVIGGPLRAARWPVCFVGASNSYQAGPAGRRNGEKQESVCESANERLPRGAPLSARAGWRSGPRGLLLLVGQKGESGPR